MGTESPLSVQITHSSTTVTILKYTQTHTQNNVIGIQRFQTTLHSIIKCEIELSLHSDCAGLSLPGEAAHMKLDKPLVNTILLTLTYYKCQSGLSCTTMFNHFILHNTEKCIHIHQTNVLIKPFLRQLMSQSAIQKPSVKPQTASNADVEGVWISGCPLKRRGHNSETILGEAKVSIERSSRPDLDQNRAKEEGQRCHIEQGQQSRVL